MMRVLFVLVALLLALPSSAASLIVHSKWMVSEGINAGQEDGPKCIEANGWPPPGNGQCNMFPISSVGGGIAIETHRVSIDMTKYPGATYLIPGSTFFFPTFNTATLEYRANLPCAGCDNQVIGQYSTANFNYSSEYLLNTAAALAGSYRITMTGGQSSFNASSQMVRSYQPPSTGVLKIWVKAASGGAYLQGATVQIWNQHQAVGGLQYIAGVNGLVQTSIPGGSWRVVISGMSQSGSITNYTAFVQVTNGRTSGYTFNVVWNGVGTPSVTPSPVNPDPVDPDEPGTGGGGGEYDGPPNDASWWQEWMYELFVPSEHTMGQWDSLFGAIRTWGPYAYITAYKEAWASATGQPTTYAVVFANDNVLGVSHGYHFDFRAPCGAANPPCEPVGHSTYATRGTWYGGLRHYMRGVLGFSFYLWFGGTLLRWFRPRYSM